MQQRGRKSAAASAVAVLVPKKKLEAPEELTPEAKEVWDKVTETENLDFFSTAAAQQLLVLYCQHMSTAAKLGAAVELALEDKDCKIKDLNSLLTMRDRETRTALTVATKLRITNQSRYDKAAAGTGARKGSAGRKLWERKSHASD